MEVAKGTPVHTSRGDVAIENIHEGDSVISRNAATGKLEPEPVTALTPLHPSSLLEVRLEGQQSPLRPSINHPFWVKRGNALDGSWLRADKMQVGDFVQSLQGAWRRVVAITPLPGVETVYNFTVDKNHDYFVGQTGFLVHNAGGCGCGRRGAFRMAKRLLGVAMNTVPQVIGPGSREFGLDPTRNGRLYLFGPPEEGTPAIREDFPAEYPTGPSQGPHFNYGEFDPNDPKSLDGHCFFGED